MPFPLRSHLAVLLAMCLAAHAAAGPPGAPITGAAEVVANTAAPSPTVLRYVELVRRQCLTQRLVELGRAPAEARAMVAELTPDDLAVLAANPLMMQPAGAGTQEDMTLIYGLLIVGALIALAAATDGFVSFS